MHQVSKNTLKKILEDFFGIEIDDSELTLLERQLNDLLRELEGIWNVKLNNTYPLFSVEEGGVDE